MRDLEFRKPRVIHEFDPGNVVVDMIKHRKRLRWWHVRKTTILYIATKNGFYEMILGKGK